ncbi:MAG: putative lipopolysaccharide heptosyltransferase III [Verrucomicrobia bacterium]|nr:putative lipopolysaccharide heptosyltransferase III [Verrucomicrobiota bacterium]
MSYGNYPNLSSVRKILVIKLRHHGDVLLTSPVFSILKSRFPNAQIDALVYSETKPMLEGHPAIHQFFSYDKSLKKQGLFKRVAKEIGFLRTIRSQKYDLVLNLTEGDRGALLALASGAPIRVGYDPEGKGFRGKKKVFTHIVKNCKTPRHAVERNLDALRRIGIFPSNAERDLTFVIPEEAPRFSEGYILIHPVSRWRFKCPPMSFIAQLIDQLQDRGQRIVLSASPDPHEMAMIEEILAQVKEPGKIINKAGKTSLKELGALIEGSECLICVDTVALHMASALKTPTLVFFGPTSWENWGPWQNLQVKIITAGFSCQPCGMDGCGGSKKSDCLHSLSIESVMQEILNLQASFV